MKIPHSVALACYQFSLLLERSDPPVIIGRVWLLLTCVLVTRDKSGSPSAKSLAREALADFYCP